MSFLKLGLKSSEASALTCGALPLGSLLLAVRSFPEGKLSHSFPISLPNIFNSKSLYHSRHFPCPNHPALVQQIPSLWL